jgi:hypothetical protein
MDAEAVTRLRRVIGKLARLFNASSVSEDLTPTQASVLGLVAFRGPIGPADQRVVQLEATDHGREVHQRIIAARTDTVTKILADLPPDVSEALREALPALEALAEGLRTKKR